MTHPRQITHETIACHAEMGMAKRKGRYAECRGFIFPRVYVDRAAQFLPGFDSLLYHEGAHAFEYHNATCGSVLVIGVLATSLAIGAGMPWLGILAPVSVVLWLWLKRSHEATADAMALWGAGAPDFEAMLLMHRAPTSRFGRWCYGATIEERRRRAYARMSKLRKREQ